MIKKANAIDSWLVDFTPMKLGHLKYKLGINDGTFDVLHSSAPKLKVPIKEIKMYIVLN